MKQVYRYLALAAFVSALPLGLSAALPDEPAGVVEKWSDASTSPKIIDINFSDTTWPDTWKGETAMDCPDFSSGGYVNAVLSVPANGSDGVVNYPVMFHNCTFATKASFNGRAGTTAAFGRQFYEDRDAVGSAGARNDWTCEGHKIYLEDNIKFDGNGKPTYGEAGFVQMCRDAASSAAPTVSMHGWVEIDHIPYVERIQWSWSNTSWGRGIKCDIKVGNGDWQPLVWMGSEKQKLGWTCFSDQGYFMENVIDKKDVSLRWRVWDGDGAEGSPDQVQKAPHDWQSIDPLAMRQAPRLHKLQIFGDKITAEQAEFAKANPIGAVGELADLSQFGFGGNEGGDDDKKDPAPDDNAEVILLSVNQDGSGDFTTIQSAINSVADGQRGIIYIAPGVYEENVYCGTKTEKGRFISLIGSDPATTILTSSVDRGSANPKNKYTDCSALNVFTDRFYAENLTIRNTAGNVGQAEALYTEGDAHVFKNCVLSGYQDTYKAGGGARGYFKNCTISGATDFIYDSGLEWFEDCKIVCVPGGGYITAPGDSRLKLTHFLYPELSMTRFFAGLFFNNCDITAEKGVKDGDYYLGRPWAENSGAMFMNCRLGSHINARGWKEWGDEKTEENTSLFEYNNTTPDGKPVDVSGRSPLGKQALEADVKACMNPAYLFEKFRKNNKDVPFDFEAILAGVAAPANVTSTSGSISWEGDAAAAGYMILRDGKFDAFVYETTFALPDGVSASGYSVASVSRHGVISEAVKAGAPAQLKAFPTAEGFGKYATGGRGGKVVKVTSLADDGSEGTLRWAFGQYKDEPVTIVFEVSGEIVLNSQLRVSRKNWTLAGQTAPGEGIVITHNKVNVGGSENFIIRNVRFRTGHKDVAGNVLAENALGAENCKNFIVDHCSFGWSVEENMNTADSHLLTVQYSIVHEGLYDAGHHKGARGYGCQWGGSPATYHHNLLAHNKSRSARINGARGEDKVVFMEYINNVNYNYGSRGGCYGGENTGSDSYNGKNSAHECNFMNNYYKPGSASDRNKVVFVNSSLARDGAKSCGPAKWYVSGNVAEGFPTATADNWTAMSAEGYTLDQIRVDKRIVTETPWWRYSLITDAYKYDPLLYMMEEFESAEDAFKTVVAKAGTVNRDKVERRVAEDALNGTARFGNNGIIDKETDAEGFFAYDSTYTVPVDTDGDGMPDEWEKKNGLDPNVADNNRLNSEGYTALEVYLNSLMGEILVSDFGQSGIEGVLVSPEVSYDSRSHILTVGEEAIGASLEVYGLDGRLMESARIAGNETSLSHLAAGVYLIRVSSRTITPSVLKIKR